jgi:hypothetical protein
MKVEANWTYKEAIELNGSYTEPVTYFSKVKSCAQQLWYSSAVKSALMDGLA